MMFWPTSCLLSAFVTSPAKTATPSSSVRVFVSQPQPIDGSNWPSSRFPAKEHCSRCGLCETSFVANVTQACAFLPALGMQRIDEMEKGVHGRSRISSFGARREVDQDETRFGVLEQPIQLVRGVGVDDAQWTGVVTSIALSMLESKIVDAVACIRAGPGGWNDPEPLLATTPEQVLQGRGVKPALAPSLRVLDEIHNSQSIRNVLFCGVGCAVQAFRAVQDDLDVDNVYVLGTNCADNSPTPEMAQAFVQTAANIDDDASILGYEFMQDYRVHVKAKGGYSTVPYFSLPGTLAETSIAKSCLACFDYTNALADVVVGYMGAPLRSGDRMDQSSQTLTIRNPRGAFMVDAAVACGRIKVEESARGRGSFEPFAVTTLLSDPVILSLIGDTVKDEGLPIWLGELFAFLLKAMGPKELNFAKYSIDYHILRNYLYVIHKEAKHTGQNHKDSRLPLYAREIVSSYFYGNDQLLRLERKITGVKS